MMKLEKSMVFFNTSIRGNEVMLAKLQNIFQEPEYIDKDLVEDVEIELKQAHNTVISIAIFLRVRWTLSPLSSPTT